MSYRVFILTVSDTASRDATTDKSGPAIQTTLTDKNLERRFAIGGTKIVADDVAHISEAVKSAAESGSYDWIVTTGGTGFGNRDCTPEAVSPLIERSASGIVHLLISSSLKHTPLAALSRPVAGMIKGCLVVTLPGSPKAVRESLEALLQGGVISHALELIVGGSGKAVHRTLGVEERVVNGPAKKSDPAQPPVVTAHHCHIANRPPRARTLLSNDPALGAAARARESPYPMITLEQALTIIVEEARVLEVVTRDVNHHLSGSVLAEDVYAPYDFPPFQTSRVDGYAIRSTDEPGKYKVVDPLNHSIHEPVPEGTVYRINTGTPLPAGTDAVLMVEDTRLISSVMTEDGEEEEEFIETLSQINPKENVRSPGSDVMKGEKVMERGEIIASTGGEVGTLTFVAKKQAQVFRKPVIALLSTGNEVFDLHKSSEEDGKQPRVWDTNRPSLQSALLGMGYEVIDLGVVKDDVTAHVTAMKEGLAKADVLLTTGGSSMGSSDLLKPVIERHLNGTIHFGRVDVKPGKPTTFATIPTETIDKNKLVFALPGNPAAAVVTFYLFVVPALRKLGGWPTDRCAPPRVRVQVQQDMRLDSRPGFHRAFVRSTVNGLTASSTGGQCSSRVGSLAGANGFVALPGRKEGDKAIVTSGDWADAVLIGEIQAPEVAL